jgi:hypothetical protein
LRRVGSSRWALEHRADPPDRAVALLLVEQLIDHRAECPAVAEELLEGPRQPPVAIREVGSQRLFERCRGSLVDLLGLAHHPLELGADGVDVDRHADVLQCEQTDPQGALGDGFALCGLTLPEERGKGRVRDRQAVDDDPIALESNGRV